MTTPEQTNSADSGQSGSNALLGGQPAIYVLDKDGKIKCTFPLTHTDSNGNWMAVEAMQLAIATTTDGDVVRLPSCGVVLTPNAQVNRPQAIR